MKPDKDIYIYILQLVKTLCGLHVVQMTRTDTLLLARQMEW